MTFANKNNAFTQFARTAEDGDTLNRTYTLTENKGSEVLVDDNGRLIVRVVDAPPGGSSVYTSITGLAGTNPGTDQVTLNVGAAATGQLMFYHRDVVPRFFQIHDVAVPLVGGEVPLVQFEVPGNRTNFNYDLPTQVTSGLVVAFSTTELTYTAGAISFSIFGAIYT